VRNLHQEAAKRPIVLSIIPQESDLQVEVSDCIGGDCNDLVSEGGLLDL